jgi:hypothetical protein
MNKQPANRREGDPCPSQRRGHWLGQGSKPLQQLSSFCEGEIKQLHSIGAVPIRQLRQVLAERGLSFAAS